MNEPEPHSNNDKSSSRMSRFGFRKPRIYPPVWLALSLLAMFGFDRFLPVMEFSFAGASVAAWSLFGVGAGMVLVAAGGFRKVDTGVVPFSKSTALVTGGIYRVTRNPMYLGMALVLAGVAIKLGALSAWIPIPVFMVIIQKQFIENEEIFLTAIYGDDYRDYCRRVRRWI